ncbi:MAG TPA: TraR/DksA C4-type zinc finger protein [Thermodesulfobacteriota bacterium]|nr:TraR/DksA C4-type zinc finger protein [Thermodesulfobacteriota bacterium]
MAKNDPNNKGTESLEHLSEKDLKNFQEMLFLRRQNILHEVVDQESRWKDDSERQIEPEENAQELELSDPYPSLDKVERREVAEIDWALDKIASGGFGVCEACGRTISIKRLKSIPWTRYCIEDAEKEEMRQFIANV